MYVFATCGFSVLICACADHSSLFCISHRQAIDCCIRVRPDLLLIDIHMPVKDGMEAARDLRAMPQFERLPIVAISADQFAPEDQVPFSLSIIVFRALLLSDLPVWHSIYVLFHVCIHLCHPQSQQICELFTSVITKPVNPESLFALISKHVRSPATAASSGEL